MKYSLDVKDTGDDYITLNVSSISDMLCVGELISKYVTYPDIVTLSGDLGMGKTVLARSIITNQLGYNEQVRSPSYLICLTYKVSEGKTISHIDPYRLRKR